MRGLSPSKFGYAKFMPDLDAHLPEAAALPDYSDDGVDLTLIRWTLSLSPAERLEFLDDRIADILAIRDLNAKK
jgi:hypothetical protein